ncbi:deSI-like protein At4g17486 [Zingiber officinale]|uniref:deSI-like protein At4g17486 n=1 Tax=Zingiber officinale TaxID=94328 RepID=UPI001C4D9211|nr:deSI-like protein At4g17486 [Zingiber officinale]
MKLLLKKGKNPFLPFRINRASSGFSLFLKARSASKTSGNVPVYLNVYDLTSINGYMYWAGLGIFHTGVEVHGVEYAFGAHDYPTSGIFEVDPRQCPGFRFRKSIFMGTTHLDPLQVREFVEIQSLNYNGDTYQLITKNCNHFCQDICYQLTGKSIPKWVNRLARIGSVCNFLLPEPLKTTVVRHDPDSQIEDGERRKLTSPYSCPSSISTCQKQFRASSLFLPSPFKGSLSRWELRRSSSCSVNCN